MYESASSFKRINNKKKCKSKNKNNSKKSGLQKFLLNIIIKTLVVIVLFLMSSIYVKKDEQSKEKFKKIVYQNSLSFAKIYSLYNKYLGDVIPFKNVFKDNVKVASTEKITYEKIVKEGNGFVLTVASEYVVPVINEGIVVEVKKDNKYLNIIKIQDKNGLNISYGYLSDLNVKLYDYVQKGQILGKCNKKLYLMFEKENKYLSYDKYL